jgi:prepilin-type N-terminal cleavage/methylation domain-containing protein/prepilin-type processing-associated H-X9-DG protein
MGALRKARIWSSSVGSFAAGFTLVELLVTIAVLAVLASLILPALASAKAKAQGMMCMNNHRQLSLACMIYTGDSQDALPYNAGSDDIKRWVAKGSFVNWTSSIMSWELDPDNTNQVLLTEGGLGPYVHRVASVYHCPADRVVSDIQAEAGWRARVRSISMNAMTGNAGSYSQTGSNTNNPGYRQFFLQSQIPNPVDVFVFIEEHPDSINDGYFLNKPDSGEWIDLPASNHNGTANLTYADGHAEAHRWLMPSTKRPARPDGALLPFAPPLREKTDYLWLMQRTSVDAD